MTTNASEECLTRGETLIGGGTSCVCGGNFCDYLDGSGNCFSLVYGGGKKKKKTIAPYC